MRIVPRNDTFTKCTAERYAPDNFEDCAVCGAPVRWPWEPVAWDADGNICHAGCVEKEGPQ